MVRKGDLYYSITLITRNLLILHSAQWPKCPTIPLPLYVDCTANALHKKKPRRCVFSQCSHKQFGIGPSHRSRPPFENAWNGEHASKPFSESPS